MRLRVFILVGFALTTQAQIPGDIYFLPCAPKASVRFEGITQAGRDLHRLEVRRLAYVSQSSKSEMVTGKSCVLYFAGDEYGPNILLQIDDCIDPVVRRMARDLIEIYFLAGAHTHVRQRWRLLGHTAKLEKEETISWRDDPRIQSENSDPKRRLNLP